MLSVNIAVLVSGGGTNLQALIDAQKRGELGRGEIKLVISNRKNAYALQRAENNGIETAYVKMRRGDSACENELLELLQKKGIDMLVLAGYLAILGENIINAYRNRIINIHPSLIPSFCGMGYYGLKVHEAALEYGVKVTGATVHYVNEIADGGKIFQNFHIAVNAAGGGVQMPFCAADPDIPVQGGADIQQTAQGNAQGQPEDALILF